MGLLLFGLRTNLVYTPYGWFLTVTQF